MSTDATGKTDIVLMGPSKELAQTPMEKEERRTEKDEDGEVLKIFSSMNYIGLS